MQMVSNDNVGLCLVGAGWSSATSASLSHWTRADADGTVDGGADGVLLSAQVDARPAACRGAAARA